MGSATLLDQVWKLLANDATFLSYIGWTSTLTQSASAGAVQVTVKDSVSYLSGEQIQIANGSGGWVTVTITQSGTSTTIPVSALPSAVSANSLTQSHLTPSSNGASKAARIVKEEETDGIVDNTKIPIVLLYTRPGHPDARTIQAYTAKVVVDCFTADGNTARKMVDQAHALMHNWKPPNVSAYGCVSAYDTSFKTGITGVKGHRKFFDVLTYVG